MASATVVAPRTRPRPPVRGRPETTLRVVRPPVRRARSRAGLRVGLIATAAAAAILTIVAFHVYLAQTQLDLDRVHAATAVAEQRYEDARLRYAQLASPEHVTQRAAELGLVTPSRPPIAVAVTGPLPRRDRARGPLTQWGEVKRNLDQSP